MKKLILFIIIIPALLAGWSWSWDQYYVIQEEKFDSLQAGKLKADTLVTVVARCDTIRGLAALLFATAAPCGTVSMTYNKFAYIDTIFPCSGTYSALGLPTNHWAKGWVDSLTTTYIIGAVAMADSLWSAGKYRTGNAFLRNDNDTFRTLVGDSIWSLTARCSTVVSDSTITNFLRAKSGGKITLRETTLTNISIPTDLRPQMVSWDFMGITTGTMPITTPASSGWLMAFQSATSMDSIVIDSILVSIYCATNADSLDSLRIFRGMTRSGDETTTLIYNNTTNYGNGAAGMYTYRYTGGNLFVVSPSWRIRGVFWAKEIGTENLALYQFLMMGHYK